MNSKSSKSSVIIAVIIIVFILIFTIFKPFTIIPSGYVGVGTILGVVLDNPLYEGFHIIFPIEFVNKMNIKTQEFTMDQINCITKDGLNLLIDITILHRLNPQYAPKIFKTVGKDYKLIILKPVIRAVIRDIISQYTAQDAYSNKREEIKKKIRQKLSEKVERRGIIIEDVLIRNIKLPSRLLAAIERKLTAEQEAEQMKYILEKEKREAERKKIEAEGISQAQKIIANSLTKEYLQWYYIENLKKLVNSPNNTILVLPFDQKLTPMLNIDTNKTKDIYYRKK